MPSVLGHDLMSNGKAEPNSFLLGSVERVEYLREILRVNTGTRICDFDYQFTDLLESFERKGLLGTG